jgi:hypothetical protein
VHKADSGESPGKGTKEVNNLLRGPMGDWVGDPITLGRQLSQVCVSTVSALVSSDSAPALDVEAFGHSVEQVAIKRKSLKKLCTKLGAP